MKVIHVLSGLTKGGGERMAVELANKSAENGDVVTLIAGWPVNPEYLQDKVHPSVEVKFIGSGKWAAYRGIFSWIWTNRKWICSNDVLHCHLTFGSVFGSLARILLNKTKRPAIIETNHAVGMPVPKLNRWLQSRMLARRDGVVFMAMDPYWKNFVSKHPLLPAAIIPNGISVLTTGKNAAGRQSLLNENQIPGNCKYLVGSVSMLRPDRNPILYVHVFAEIYKILGDTVHFILGGAGTEHEKIKDLVQKNGLSGNFHLPGLVNDTVTIFSNLDIYVSVSVGETAGISMIEAAMCHTPVVAIQLTKNYQAKEEDWVWSHTDTKEVAKKIVDLLENRQLRDDITVKQNQFVTSNFTSAAMYQSYHSFYSKITDGLRK